MEIFGNNKNNIILESGKNSFVVEVFDSFDCQKKIQFGEKSKTKYLLVSYKSDISIDFVSVGNDIDAEIFCLLLWESYHKNYGKFICKLQNSGCKINLYTLSFLLDASDVQVDAWIVIEENIKNVEGYLLEENIILWENIKIKTLPLLDVKSDEVKASHGAKIHKLNSEKMFYMESRWLSKKLARKLIVESYINSVFELFIGISEKDKNLKNIKISFLENIFGV